MDDQRLRAALSTIEDLDRVVEDVDEDRWPQILDLLRRNLRILDEFSMFNGSYDIQIQAATLSYIQKIAYSSSNADQASDIRNWCLETWLRLLHQHGDEVPILQGIGQWWLLRGQEILARIRTGSSSSGDETEGTAHQSADHVEARAILIPAVDYFRRAVECSQLMNTIEGPLLASAAEAHINLGSITHSRESRSYFQRAIYYIRAASLLPNYELSEELQNYLDEYGNLV